MSSDYTRLVPGTKVYYTGDVCNQCATGAITQRISDRWGVRFEITWDADADYAKEPSCVSACVFGTGAGTRFWLMEDWAKDRAQKIEELSREMQKWLAQSATDAIEQIPATC